MKYEKTYHYENEKEYYLLIYEELIQYTIDYLGNVIDFDTLSLFFEKQQLKTKFMFKIDKYIDEIDCQVIIEIYDLIQDRLSTINDENIEEKYKLSKKKFDKLLKNILQVKTEGINPYYS